DMSTTPWLRQYEDASAGAAVGNSAKFKGGKTINVNRDIPMNLRNFDQHRPTVPNGKRTGGGNCLPPFIR
ncbi:MAG: hypothetical protein J4O02_08490, partial [Chloroflexi bacterium]|nr:hypothetical protein [Chloroflexota bacterium]